MAGGIRGIGAFRASGIGLREDLTSLKSDPAGFSAGCGPARLGNALPKCVCQGAGLHEVSPGGQAGINEQGLAVTVCAGPELRKNNEKRGSHD